MSYLEKPIKDIDAQELKKIQAEEKEDSYVLVDVRQPEEYTEKHLPGALLAPLPDLESKLFSFDARKNYIFYCRSGNRSRAAARLARDSGMFEKEIYNLKGGILAYEGETLSNWPNFRVFAHLNKLEEVVKQAIELEKGAYLFYKRINEEFAHVIGREFASFEELEKKHAHVIYKWAKGKQVSLEGFELLFEKASGEILEGGKSLEDWLEEVKKQVDRNYLLEVALQIEIMAYDLYKNLVFQSFEEDSKSLFLILAEQEKVHMRVIAQKFSKEI